jgi:hypothetical protein
MDANPTDPGRLRGRTKKISFSKPVISIRVFILFNNQKGRPHFTGRPEPLSKFSLTGKRLQKSE